MVRHQPRNPSQLKFRLKFCQDLYFDKFYTQFKDPGIHPAKILSLILHQILPGFMFHQVLYFDRFYILTSFIDNLRTLDWVGQLNPFWSLQCRRSSNPQLWTEESQSGTPGWNPKLWTGKLYCCELETSIVMNRRITIRKSKIVNRRN